MATRADQIERDKPQRPQPDATAPVRPLKIRVTSTADLIERSVDRHRETLDILAKR